MNKQLFYHQQGFNLAELLVAMAILGIGLAIAIPSFSNLTRANVLSAQASEFQTALNYARNEAIRLNSNVVLCHSANQSTCSAPPSSGWQGWIIRQAGNTIGAETGNVLRQGLIDHSEVKITSDTNLAEAKHVIRFNSLGLARKFDSNSPLSAQIQVCIPNPSIAENLYNVSFNSGGRSEVIRVNNSGACP